MNRRFPFSILGSVLMAAAEAAQSTGSAAPAASTEVPSTNAEGAAPATPKRAPKNPDNILNIVNGRIPLVFGYLIRFKETGSNSEIAKKYCTSVGKVFDLKKGRNFAYLTESYKPTAEELAAGEAWLTAKTAKGQTLQEAGANPDAIREAMKALGVATAEEAGARNWNIRQVGVASGTAPAAAPAAQGAQPAAQAAEKPAGAKLF